MLQAARLMGFLQVTDRAAAKAFYVETLGLLLVSEDAFALVVEHAGTKVRIGEQRSFVAAPFTVLGWEVPDIEGAVAELVARGVEFQHYGFEGQDDRGIWTAPGGDRVAWFRDPAGNVLSVSSHR